MEQTPIWKPLLIVVVLALCGTMLYPPKEKLKPGLDLVGGTTLTYQVDVPEGMNAKEAIDQAIASLKKRVDPNGVRNLVWRPQAGNRFEVQMAHAPKETRERRDAYQNLLEELGKHQLDERKLNRIVRQSPEQRDAALNEMAGKNETLRQQLSELAAKYDALTAASAPVEKLDAQVAEVYNQLEKLDDQDAQDAEKKPLQDKLIELRAQLQKLVPIKLKAEGQYNQTLKSVLASNLDSAEVAAALQLPDELPQEAGEDAKTFRDTAIGRIVEKHPDRENEIREIVAAYESYEEVKGPLDDPADLIALMRGSGVLEFRIGASPGTVPDISTYIQQLQEKGPRAGGDKPWRWLMCDRDEQGNISFAETRKDRAELEEDPKSFFASRRLVGELYAGEYYVLLGNAPQNSLTKAQPGWKLNRAFRTMDQSGFPAVSFNLNSVGGSLMGQLTGAHVNEPMAICLDGRVISAPNIQSKIHGSGIITGGTGGFSTNELTYLIRTLNAGSLQAAVSDSPISKKTIGSQFGADNLQAGLKASFWALGVVAIFMVVYYFFGGFIAVLALAANMIVILGVMCLMQATWTLPGIAGIILTIGMAVDANVLIFERIREEIVAGEQIHIAIKRGYGKAFSTILDANITTIITCTVLYHTATTEIKGFALTLGIGIAATLFTALFCSRTVIEYWFRFTGAKNLPSLPLAIPAIERALTPKVDWVSKRKIFIALSLLISVLGIFSIITRGEEMLDIEFRSGTEVGFELTDNKTLSLTEVRDRMDKVAAEFDEPLLGGDRARILTVGKTTPDLHANGFSIQTLVEDSELVSKAVKQAFVDVLDTQQSLSFEKMGEANLQHAPIYPVTDSSLGKVIDRPIDEDISEYLGSVAILLNNITPATTEDELQRRIGRMRLQPPHDELGFRHFEVIGLELGTGEDAGLYRSAVVLTRDNTTNYIDDPQAFLDDQTGLAHTEWNLVRDALTRDTSLSSVSSFTAQISGAMKTRAMQAMFLSLFAVVIYIWIRFGRIRYGFAAILALIHDVLIALGLVAISYMIFDSPIGRLLLISDFKINLAMVAALLTIVGYSLNDTIVVFDRIRENRGRLAEATPEIINQSINQTFSRTVVTSVTTIMAVGTLYVFGGEGVHGFAFAMLVGVLVGTYSSVAIAAPLLLLGRKLIPKMDDAPAPAPTNG